MHSSFKRISECQNGLLCNSILCFDIPGNGRIMLLCRGKAASATITWGASILVPGKSADGGRFILLSSSCDPNELSLKMPPSLSRPYPPTSAIVNRYLASHIVNDGINNVSPLRTGSCSVSNMKIASAFTFSHLADAFIQSNLQGCIHILHLH